MLTNPKLFEINTRIWLKNFNEGTTLSKIPENFFDELASKGINIIWLMGVWETCTSIIEQCCFNVDLVSSYNRSLSDWKKEDVIGSPFAIDTYEVNPVLGTWSDLLKLRSILNKKGIKLFLDFIPNHFGAGSKFIKTNPEIFLQADEDSLKKDSYTFFKPDMSDKIFAHGRDPLFPAWTDTVQVNYFCNAAREFMLNILLKIAEVCDGVRCDMAMLPLNNIFYNTWVGVLHKNNVKRPEEDFWSLAIREVKSVYPEFIFLAEAYWDLEWDLQQLGFDFTYDKRLTDRLTVNDIAGVKAHLNADHDFQMKSVRFIENHDEQRAVIKFGKQKSIAASVVMATVQGMKLFFDGQFEGKKIKLPLQLGREPKEKISLTVKKHYDKLLSITKSEIFEKGEWKMLEAFSIGPGENTYDNIFAWQWSLNKEFYIIVVNYSDVISHCRIKLDFLNEWLSKNTKRKSILLIDELNEKKYYRSFDEIVSIGLYISLNSYKSHIFKINL